MDFTKVIEIITMKKPNMKMACSIICMMPRKESLIIKKKQSTCDATKKKISYQKNTCNAKKKKVFI